MSECHQKPLTKPQLAMNYSAAVQNLPTHGSTKPHIAPKPSHTVLLKCGEVNQNARPNGQQVSQLMKNLSKEIPAPFGTPKVSVVNGGIAMELTELAEKNNVKGQIEKVMEKLNLTVTEPKSRQPRMLIREVPTVHTDEDMKVALKMCLMARE